MNTKEHKSQVGFWASRMFLGTLFSRILGLIRDVLIAQVFTRTQTDVFFVAFRFPNFFRRFLGENSFSASVTPALTESLYRDESGKEAKRLSSVLFTLLCLVSSFLTVVGIVFMDSIIEFLFSDSLYAQIEGKIEQTILISRVVFGYLFLVTSYSYLMSMAQVKGRFFLPALAPAFFNLALIVFILLPQNWWPIPTLALAFAVLVGGLIQVVLVFFLLYQLDFWPRFSIQFKKAPVVKVLKRVLPALLGFSGLSLIGLINVYFAGWLEEGSHTYIYYGDRLLELPRSLIAISLGTALIPELSQLKASQKTKEFFATATHYFDLLLFLTLPCAIVLYLLPEALIEVLFQRGQFGEEAVSQTGTVLRMYSLVLIFASGSRVLSSCFFALDKNWLCVFANMAYVLFHAAAAWWFTLNYGFKGLIFSTAISSLFYFIVLLFLLYRYAGFFPFHKTLFRVVKMLPGLILFAFALLSYDFSFNMLSHVFSPWWSQLSALFSVFLVGGCLYLVMGFFFERNLTQETLNLFLRQRSSKKS